MTLTVLIKGGLRMLRRKFFKEEKSDDDSSIYSREMRESLLDDDELSPVEEAFMNGYEDAA